jgi:DNA-binding Lrp family transcriptional regulator
MGRNRKEVDLEKLLDFSEKNLPQKEMAEELGVSIPTLAKRMSEIREKQGILMQYRDLQSLQLTSMQARILEAITPQKINEASLRDLILAFRVLKDKEHTIEGKPTEVKGLVHYLLEIEKQENIEEVEKYTAAEFEEAADAAALVTVPPVREEEDVTDPNFEPVL